MSSGFRTRNRGVSGALQGMATAAGLLVALLAGSAQVGAGIIELGKKGQSATNSVFRVVVEGKAFTDPTHAGQTAEQILEDIRALIDADPQYTATTASDPVDPNNIPAIRVLRESGAEVADLAIFEDDTTVIGAGAVASTRGALDVSIQGVSLTDVLTSGQILIDITLSSGPALHVAVSTNGKTPAQVNAEIRNALGGCGLLVTGPANGPFTVTRPPDTISRVYFFSTDPGVTVSGVRANFSNTAQSIPALSAWGLVVLAVLVVATALVLIRRKRAFAGA